MNRFVFDLARKSDDACLRKLISNDTMGDRMRLTYSREPHFFDGLAIHGKQCQLMVVRDTYNNNLAGYGMRSVLDGYVNGKSATFGYLGGLRLRTDCRNGLLLSRGYEFLRKLHIDNPVPFYLTTIIEDNVQARTILESGRAFLPHYEDLGLYITFALKSKPKSKRVSKRCLRRDVLIRKATRNDVQSILGFVSAVGIKRQFYPRYYADDLLGNTDFFKAFDIENDAFVATRGQSVVGVFASWSQSSFKQVAVAGYNKPLTVMRPLINLYSIMRGGLALPKTGTSLLLRYGSLLAAEDNNPDIVEGLMTAVLDDCWQKKSQLLLVGLHESDLLCKLMQRHTHVTYRSRTYMVYWDADRANIPIIDNRRPFIEVGRL